MPQIRYTQQFGSHLRGSVEDVPDMVAQNLIKVHVAELASEPVKAVDSTEQYTADKVVRQRVVRKAKEPDGVQ